MIKNITEGLVQVKWSGKEMYISPNQCIDIGSEFGVQDKHLLALEDRFVSKAKGKLIKFIYETPAEIIPQEEPEEEKRGRGRPRKV